MSAATIAKRLSTAFTLRPLDGHPNACVIVPKAERFPLTKPQVVKGRRREMTAEDWDKFEADIAEVFEQVP